MIFDSPYHCRLQFSKEFKKSVKKIADAVRLLQADPDTYFDAIVVCGKSGISVAFALKMIIDIDVVVVRKHCDTSQGLPIEGPDRDIKRLLFLDDLIDTGSTLDHVRSELNSDWRAMVAHEEMEYGESSCLEPHVVGVLLYGSSIYPSSEMKADPDRRNQNDVGFLYSFV